MKLKDSGLGKIIVGNIVFKLVDKVGVIGGLIGFSLFKVIVFFYNVM